MKRREFLGALGVLSLGFDLGCAGNGAIVKHASMTGELAPNAWVTVRRDGRVVVEVERAEIGQGVTTMYTTLVADELDTPIESVEAHYADSHPAYQTTFGVQLTGGSMSTREGFLPIRRAAATAREMLVGAAAATWGVTPAECRTENGFVVRGRDRLAYGDLTVKAAQQPVPSKPRLKTRAEFRLIGKHDRRVDTRPKVDGTAKFGMDVVVPGMVRAWAIHAPVFGANAKSVSDERARKIPGVIDVVTYPGGVAVVAEKTWQAIAAAKLVEVTWGEGAVAGLDTGKLRAAMRAHTQDGEPSRDDGNARKAIAAAASQLDVTYEAPYLCHAPMEPQNCVVHVKGDQVEVWAPHQAPTFVQAALAEALGVSREDVLVHTTLVGGGFGRRTPADVVLECAHISKGIKRPVQLTWSRESDMTQAQYRPILAGRMRGGVSRDGKVAGIDAHILGQPLLTQLLDMFRGAVPVPRPMLEAVKGILSSNTVTDLASTEGITDTSYTVENLRVAFTPIHTRLPVMFWRSVGHSFNGFVMESFVDELAYAARVDPFEFRRHMLPAGSRARRVLEAIAPAWNAPKAPGIGRGIARHTSFESEVAEVADVEIVNGRIKVRRVHVVVDCGLVVNPDIVRAQMEGGVIFGLSAALDQEITLVDGVVQQRNFDTFPALRMFECPEITVTILESDAKPTGVGEPGLPPIAPAVANAIMALTGRRLRRLPLQKELDAS